MKNVSGISDIPEVTVYLRRIGAEARSLLAAVVKEQRGAYYTDLAVIRFSREGDITAPENFAPTDSEVSLIKDAFSKYKFPTQQPISNLANLPAHLDMVSKEDLFIFRNLEGLITMLQVRKNNEDGGKNYVPWTYWDDGEWRAAEPEDALPLWGLDQLADHSVVFIHEGAKAARAIRDMVRAETKEAKEALAAHPWGDELSNAAHVGWIGGALSPYRTDWGSLKRAGITRAYIVSDNDNPGITAVPAISMRLRVPTWHVQFTNEWPVSFDLADDFPDDMFKEIDGVTHYNGPAFRSCLHPATWATDLIQNPKGKPSYALREHFKAMWVFVEQSDLWVCSEMPEIIRTEQVLNKMFSSFSHSANTCSLLLKQYQGRSTKICYRPDVEGRIVTDRSTSAINLHIPSQVKSVAGSAEPFLDFMKYMFPNEDEMKGALKWCATLIARPRWCGWNTGCCLLVKPKGSGKRPFGSDILAKLVGDHNVSYPSEKTITTSDFTDWIAQKRLIVVNEIYSGHSWKAYNTLKSYITDKTVNVNEKYQKPYTIDNWAHIIAMSNSQRALKMEQDDRRWFYPEVTEVRWGREEFTNFHNWLASGGLSIIKHWADEYGEYVRSADRAPMTDRKVAMIGESRTEAQEEIAALAEAAVGTDEPVVLAMRNVVEWVREQTQGKVFDSDYELRKCAQDVGMFISKTRVYINGRLQYVMSNKAAVELMRGLKKEEVGTIARTHYKPATEVMANDM